MPDNKYLMESDEEAFRLDMKTVTMDVEHQALWAGIKPGMRVADISCGAGKTTSILHRLVQPGGTAVGIDLSEKRLAYAQSHYGNIGIDFLSRDIRASLEDLGTFDFVWVRFFLEYYRSTSFEIVQNISKIVKPGGTLCLIDLDHNGLNHYGLSERLEDGLSIPSLKFRKNSLTLIPMPGENCLSHLYRLGFTDISVDVTAHHVIYGPLNERDAFNWFKKVEIAAEKLGGSFEGYENGATEFLQLSQTVLHRHRQIHIHASHMLLRTASCRFSSLTGRWNNGAKMRLLPLHHNVLLFSLRAVGAQPTLALDHDSASWQLLPQKNLLQQ